MREFCYTIRDEAGIHARPAGMLVKLLQGFASTASITCEGKTVDGKKLFALMGLAAKQGETITLRMEGDDAAEAERAARAFLEEHL